MPDFKYAVFMFEDIEVPDDLKVMKAVAEVFSKLPQAATTLVQVAHTLEEAAPLVDNFKAQTCGSPYTLAIISLNMMTDVREVDFLLRSDVLGDPRTIFLASLKYMVGDAYALARAKIQREDQTPLLSESCLECYGSGNRDEVPPRIAQLAAAYLHEAEELEKARQEGRVGLVDPSASGLLKKSQTAFYGKTMKSGFWKSTSDTSRRLKKASGPAGADSEAGPPKPEQGSGPAGERASE